MKSDQYLVNKQKGDNMKIIITTIILTLFSSLSFADGHTSGKFNASGMGAWEVNVMNAGKGDMSVTYDGIAGLIDDNPESIFHKSTMHCIGGLTLQAGKFSDETGMCRFDLFDGESVYMKYEGEGTGGVGGTGTFEIIKGTGKYEKITGTGFSSRQNLKSKAPGFSTSMNQMSGEYKY